MKTLGVEIDTLHWLDPGLPSIDTPHWLWAPEAIDALPWADKLPAPDSPPAEEQA